MRIVALVAVVALCFVAAGVVPGCGQEASPSFGPRGGSFGGDAAAPDTGSATPADAGGSGDSAPPPSFGLSDASPGQDAGFSEQPQTCAEAASTQSYIGCEFWPTVVFNPVWSVFDFAAVVANTGMTAADVNVDRGGSSIASTTVAPSSVGVLYLPWVTDLKGPDFNDCTVGARPTASVFVSGGAYHLTSSVPVTVWQFSPLEYKAGSGGPPSKNWMCPYPPALCNGNGVDCLSVSNDASLLLPTPALTGNYRLFGWSATTYGSVYPPDQDQDSPGAFAITATQPNTHVTVSLVAAAAIATGTGVGATSGGDKLQLTMGTGDVVELLDTRGMAYNSADTDMSGSVVTADRPIQVIALDAITDVPSPIVAGGGWADHLEETVLPGESLGSHYLVVPPTAPAGGMTRGHYVRFYGNRDGTALAYPSGTPPAGAPSTLSAGQVVDLGGLITDPFEVRGSNEFAIASIMPGGQIQDPNSPNDPQGDPSLTFAVAVEQFRSQYVFLAPTDYAESYADIVAPHGTRVTLDGQPLSSASGSIGGAWDIYRALLGGTTGAHVVTSDSPAGVQVMGFGHATSYYSPGGMNVRHIAPPPQPPQ
jgi:hypothetical protein